MSSAAPLLGPPQPPSRELLCVTAIALVVAGNTGLGVPAVVDRYISGDDHSGTTLSVYLPLHLIALGTVVACLSSVVPTARQCMEHLEASAIGYDARWDNCKFFLTQVIAQGHFQDPWWGQLPVLIYRTAEDWWIMPTYAFICGYCSAPVVTRARLRRLWTSVAFAYVINQMLCLVLSAFFLYLAVQSGSTARVNSMFAAGEFQPANWNLLIKFWCPVGVMWYLSCLVMWRMMAPFWMEVRC